MDNYLKISTSNIDIPFVENFLKDNPTFNISDIFIHKMVDGRKRKYTLAYYAILNNKLDLLDYLIDSNVDLNVENYGTSILCSAVQKGDLALLKKLHKADAHLFDIIPTLITPLGIAIMKHNFEIAEYLLDNGVNLRNAVNLYQRLGFNLMQYVIDQKYDNIVELLVKHDPYFCVEIELSNLNVDGVEKILKTTSDSNINSLFILKNPYKYSPLTLVHLAVVYKNEELLDWLLKFNVDVNISIPGYGTVLCLAAKNNNFKFMKKLIKYGADVNLRTDEWSLSPLISAANIGDLELAQYLIDNGADVNAITITNSDFHGCTALHVAVQGGFEDLVELLLKNNANINMESSIHRSTPLIDACLRENLDMMEMLVARGAVYNRNTLYAAIMNKGPKVLEYLLTLDVDAIDIYFTDIKLNDPILHHLFTNKSMSGRSYLHRLRTFEDGNIEVMLDAGFNVNSLNYSNELIVELVEEPRSLNFIKRHIVKSKLAGLYVCQRNIDAVEQGYDDYRIKCDQEILKLKSDEVGNSNLVFYEVLHKSFHSLAIRLKHSNIDGVVDKYKLLRAYPIYGGMIYYKLAKAQRRIEILKSVEEFLDYIFNYCSKLPYTFTRELYMYLTNENLKTLRSKL